MKDPLVWISSVISDTRVLENSVGKVINPNVAESILSHLNLCFSSYEDTPSLEDYSNLTFLAQTGCPINWHGDLKTIREFREEVELYSKFLKCLKL